MGLHQLNASAGVARVHARAMLRNSIACAIVSQRIHALHAKVRIRADLP